MSYTKNQDPWAVEDLITISIMDNFESIYTEASSYLAAHTHDDLYLTKAEMEAAYWYAGNDGSGSGSDADLIYKSAGNLHASSFAGASVPTGLVVLWYGSVASIPADWHLCDGLDGTIDMTDRLPIGAGTGSGYAIGSSGGASTFTATGSISISGTAISIAQMAAHTHPFTDYYSDISGIVTIGGASESGYTQTGYNGTTASAGARWLHFHFIAHFVTFRKFEGDD